MAGILGTIANMHYMLSDFPSALDFYQKKSALSEAIGDLAGQADGLIGVGNIYYNQGDYPTALDYYHQSLQIKEEMGDQQGAAISLNNIGYIFSTQGEYVSALDYYRRGLEIFQALKSQASVASSLNSIGNIYYQQGDYLMALEYYHQSLQIKEETGDKQGAATSLYNIANIYIYQDNDTLAQKYYLKSLQIMEEIGYKHGTTYPLNGLSNIALKRKNYEESIKYAEQALAIAQEVQAAAEMKDLSSTLYQSYKGKGDYAKALDYHELFKQLQDSLFNADKSKSIANLEAQSDILRKEKEIELLNKNKEILENEKSFQQKTTYVILTALALLLVFAYFLFRSRQQERAAKEISEERKEEIQQINEELKSTMALLNQQKDEIEQKNEDITASINYAQRIQSAALPDLEEMYRVFDELFVFFRPRDIVSGDFYWFGQQGEKVLLTAVDCTGHGVPGAFMSMIAINLLNQIVNEQGMTAPDQILTQLHLRIQQALRQGQTANRDGMDMSLICWDRGQHSLHFAGAKNPLIYFQDGELHHIGGDRISIGGQGKDLHFAGHTIALNENPLTFYLFSDGYADQFGGPKGRKRMLKGLKALLQELHTLPLATQHQRLEQDFEGWRGDMFQIDDVLLIGGRIGTK